MSVLIEWSGEDLSYCPICGAEELPLDDQPQAGTHCASTVYDCGCMITQAIGHNDYFIDKDCNEKSHRWKIQTIFRRKWKNS